jgi:hypothetical protein
MKASKTMAPVLRSANDSVRAERADVAALDAWLEKVAPAEIVPGMQVSYLGRGQYLVLRTYYDESVLVCDELGTQYFGWAKDFTPCGRS